MATLRKDFPLLAREVHGHPIIYLDSAASAQRPVQVLDAMREYDETTHANVHRGRVRHRRGGHPAGSRRPGTTSGGSSAPPIPAREIVFTKNATEGLNLVAHTWGRANLHAGRRHRPHRDGAPRQHRAVAHAGQRARADHPVDPGGRRRRPDTRRPGVAGGRGQAGRGHLHVQRAGHPQPDQRDRPGGPRRRRRGGGRRRPVGAPPTDVGDRPRRRLPGLQRPQDARPHRHRCPLGTRASSCPSSLPSSVAAR